MPDRPAPTAMIGRRLKALRLASGYETRKPFADWLGIEEGTLGTYERGERNIQPAEQIKIKRLTKVSLDWLIAGDPSHLTYDLANRLRQHIGID